MSESICCKLKICNAFSTRIVIFSMALVVILTNCQKPSALNEKEAEELFYKTWMHPNDSLIFEARQKIANESPNSRFGYYCRSWLLTRKNENIKALKVADSLVMGFPKFAEGHYLHANLREENGDLEGAIESYTKTIKNKPDFIEAYINRGSIYFTRKEVEKALEDFKKARTIDPKQPIMLHNLGNAYMSFGRRDSACLYWQQALQLGHTPVQPFVDMYCK